MCEYCALKKEKQNQRFENIALALLLLINQADLNYLGKARVRLNARENLNYFFTGFEKRETNIRKVVIFWIKFGVMMIFLMPGVWMFLFPNSQKLKKMPNIKILNIRGYG